MTLVLSFRLKLPGTETFSGLRAVSTSFRVHGILSLEIDAVTIQWGGAVQVQDVGFSGIKDEREVLPDERVSIPLALLHRATLAGWWRPRLTLQARELGALAVVPSEEYGAVRFWYARSDRPAAISIAAAINGAIAST